MGQHFVNGINKLITTFSEKRAFVEWSKLFVKRKKSDIKILKAGTVNSAIMTIVPICISIAFYAIYMSMIKKNMAQGIQTQLTTGAFLAFMSAFGMTAGFFAPSIGGAITDALRANLLEEMGYEYDPQRDTIKAPSWERGIRLGRLGYTDDSINACTARNRENDPYFRQWRDHRVYRPDTFPLASLERQLEFKIEHSYNTATVLVDVLFYMLILLCKLVRENDSLMLFSPELRTEAKDIRDYLADYHFLKDNGIHTMIQLENSITLTERRISELEAERQKISNRIRRPKSPEEQAENKEGRKAISKEIAPLRKHLNQAKRIREKSPHLYELLKLEHDMESRELRRSYERNYER